MPSNDLDNKCWKALAGIPGKARHDGFQITVIGIFDITWENLLLKIIKLILVMRYMPHCLKKYAELPYQNQNQVNIDQYYFVMTFGVNVEKMAAAVHITSWDYSIQEGEMMCLNYWNRTGIERG